MAIYTIHEPSKTGIYSRLPQYGSTADVVIKRNLMIDDIPVLNCYLDDGSKKPLFIFVHGYTQNKESNLQIIYELATEGFFVVAPDCAGHGQRGNAEGYRMCGLLQKTTAEVDKLIAHYQGQEDIDLEQIFLAGASFGGVVTYSYLVSGKYPIKAAAVLSSTPDLEAVLRLPLGFVDPETVDGKKPFVPPTETEKAETFAIGQRISPLNHWETIGKTPLMIIHGTEDEVLSLSGEIKLYELLAPTASDEQLQLHHFKGIGHASTPEMKNYLLDWFASKRAAQNCPK